MYIATNLVARLGALAASLGGLMWAAKAFYDRNDAPPWPTDTTDTLFFVAIPLLFLVGLTGLYARCRGRLREWEAISSAAFAGVVIGSVGSAFGGFSTLLEVGPLWWAEISWWMFVFGLFLTNLGLVFLGNSIVQTGALPRRGGLPVLVGALGILLILVGDPPNSLLGVYPALALWMLYGLAWAALGHALWSCRDAPVRRAAPVR